MQFIFKRDLRWFPMFTNLKTLLLNGYWYVPDDFHALACILERSPVLKLTFEFCNEVHTSEMLKLLCTVITLKIDCAVCFGFIAVVS